MVLCVYNQSLDNRFFYLLIFHWKHHRLASIAAEVNTTSACPIWFILFKELSFLLHEFYHIMWSTSSDLHGYSNHTTLQHVPVMSGAGGKIVGMVRVDDFPHFPRLSEFIIIAWEHDLIANFLCYHRISYLTVFSILFLI
jgi:hypothetical protein